MGCGLHCINVLIVILGAFASFAPFWSGVLVSDSATDDSLVLGTSLYYNWTVISKSGGFELLNPDALPLIGEALLPSESFSGDDDMYKIVMVLAGAATLFAVLNVLFACSRAKLAMLSSLLTFLFASAAWAVFLLTDNIEDLRSADFCGTITTGNSLAECKDSTIYYSVTVGTATTILAPFFAGYFAMVAVSLLALISFSLAKRAHEDGDFEMY